MKYLVVIGCSLLWISGIAQPPVGVEFAYARFRTYNAGAIFGASVYDRIYNERDIHTYTWTIGISYRHNDHHLLKLVMGKHQHGRIFDVRVFTDDGGGLAYQLIDVNQVYTYFQISPRYQYRINIGKVIIPIEVGVNLNIRHDPLDVAYSIAFVNEFNYDARFSTGIQYRFHENFIVGLNSVYHRSIYDYEYDDFVVGDFRPRQFGFEFTLIGELRKKKEVE